MHSYFTSNIRKDLVIQKGIKKNLEIKNIYVDLKFNIL